MEQCSIPLIISLLALAIMCVAFVSAIGYACYNLISKGKGKTFTEISFFVFTELALVGNIPLAFAQCYLQQHKSFFLMAFGICFIMQWYFMLVLYFQRLRNVFGKTKFRLSSRTIHVYQAIFIAMPAYLLPLIVSCILSKVEFWSEHVYFDILAVIIKILLILEFLALICTSISLLILFLWKLMQAYRCTQCDDELIAVITKLSVLGSISVCVSLLDFIVSIAFAALSGRSSVHMEWVDITSDYVNILDAFTNFCCVVMWYNCCNDCYLLVCSCCDLRCARCFKNILGPSVNQVNLENHVVEHQVQIEDATTSTSAESV